MGQHSADFGPRAFNLSCYILYTGIYSLYTGRGHWTVSLMEQKNTFATSKIKLGVKIKVKNQAWRQNKGLRKPHHGKISKLNN